MTSTPEQADSDTQSDSFAAPDPVLIASHDLALSALREITPSATIGEPADYRVEADGVVSLRFENRLGGYPGWYWTVSLAHVEGVELTVLEVELLPGDGALPPLGWEMLSSKNLLSFDVGIRRLRAAFALTTSGRIFVTRCPVKAEIVTIGAQSRNFICRRKSRSNS